MATSKIFECQICFENKEEVKSRTIDDLEICHDCIVDKILPLLKESMRFENSYPPRWGADKIEVDEFAEGAGQTKTLLQSTTVAKRNTTGEIDYTVSTKRSILTLWKPTVMLRVGRT